ncbi:MAG: YiiX/YebB-like N1pC/P60 family cysteine hydrolase [Rubripirellula sp.]
MNESDSPIVDSAAVRTVVDLADHLARLRESTTQLCVEITALDRGYFTPSEGDQIDSVWVSYHKSRCALFELIGSIRQEVGRASEEHAGQFAVGYAAALVLVDAARFLRDLFRKDDLVRRKLNESYAVYGIAANSFDQVQLSLTDPSNALQLREANEFYDSHCDSMHSLAQADPGLRAVIEVIERLRDRTEVPVRRYLRARLAERGRHAREQLVRGNVSRAVYLIQEFGSRLVSNISTMPRHVSRLPAPVIERMESILKPGDVFVTRKDSAVTNYFLPGYWPHAAMYIGGQRVVESLKDGVRERTMDSPFGNDAVAVIRPRLEQSLIAEAIERSRTHLGKPYDFDFDFTRADRMVCTEVVYRSYEGLGGLSFALTRRAGRETLSAEDLLGLALCGEQFDQVAVFCAKFSEDLLEGDSMSKVLRQTMACSV